jgi:UDP-N-acetylmuramate--alanine ligase
VSGHLVLDAVLDAHPAQEVVYLPHRADLARYVPGLVRPGDVVLTLGAGDLTTLPDEWLVPAP